MSRIFVIGDYNTDLVMYLERFPQAGETLNANGFMRGPGGKGSNQAIAAARLGAEVRLLGAIGDDQFGAEAMRVWEAEGVDTTHILQVPEAATAVATIYVGEGGDNMIAVHQGANLKLTPAHVDAAREDIAAADLLLCTLAVPQEVVQRGLEIAREVGTTSVLNTAPAYALPEEMIEAVDVMTPNESELQIVAQSGASEVTPESARQLFVREDQRLVVTQGANGATWVTATEIGHVPTYAVDVVDTVGAGDAFNAAFGVALAEGRDLPVAVQFANAAAALSVTVRGAVAGMPTRDSVEALLVE